MSGEPIDNTAAQTPIQSGGNQGISPQSTSSNPNDNENETIQLQKDIRGGEKWLIGIGIATVLINTGIALIYLCQLKQMRIATTASIRAANAAKSAAETATAGIRPWIKITAVDLRPGISDVKTLMFHWPQEGISIFPQFEGKELPPTLQIKVSMLNIGHSPAKDVETFAELYFHKFDSNKWHAVITKEEERYCKSVANRPPSGAASIAFPSDPIENNMGISGSIPSDAVMQNPTNLPSGRYSSTALILCVNYAGVGNVSYQTEAWAGLYEGNLVFIPVGIDVDSDHLRLIREPSGDHAN